jgi:hypothetical protein
MCDERDGRLEASGRPGPLPHPAITLADTDGDPATQADPDWKPLLFIPPFPEYTSGHSTFSGAAAVVLEAFCPDYS